jgi:para-nitrobenzyl esterase
MAEAGPIVATTQGAVRGVQENGTAVFRGIPYAQPPVGKLRFRPPTPPERWSGVRDATRFGEIVPQTDESPIDKALLPDVPQGDDCLNLNVWTREPGKASMPVMVWIHGGSFKWGSGSCPMYDGATFAREGIVTVSFNYRLFAAGFLHVGDRPDSGNFGLADQIAALEWVQENIASFGGDPARVTLSGQSAGAHSIGELLAAPAARGLFQRAILQSGAAQMHLPAAAAEVVGAKVVSGLRKRLGNGALESVTTTDLIAETQAAEADAVAELAEHGVGPGPMTMMTGITTLPVHGTDLLPEPALAAIDAGAAAGVDLLVGSNADEWAAFVPSPEALNAAETQTATVADAVFASAGKAGADALDAYRRNRSGDGAEESVVPFGTDMVFRIPAIRLAEAAQRHNPSTYMFRFGFRGRFGAAHAIELPFVFDALDRTNGEVLEFLFNREAPQELATTVHGAWANFVKTGSPQHANLPEWPTYDSTRRATMELDVESRVVDDPDAQERRLWDGVQY